MLTNGADHLEQAIARLKEHCARAPPTPKIQRRLLRYQGDVLRCGDEIQALYRFTSAQVEAFRKILKKYKVRQNLHDYSLPPPDLRRNNRSVKSPSY